MEAVGQLTGGIAHDFNNLLTGVIGSLDLMHKRIAQKRFADVERYATLATTSANRAAALTHRLLAFARRSRSTQSLSMSITSCIRSRVAAPDDRRDRSAGNHRRERPVGHVLRSPSARKRVAQPGDQFA
jgi:signal transduction histidine kinase